MIRINLLPVRAAKKKEVLRQHAVAVAGLLVVLAGVLAGVHFALGSQIAELQRMISDRKTEIIRLQGVIGEVTEFKKKKRELEDKIGIIAGLEERQRGPAQVLFELAQLVPEKMWLENVKDIQGSLSISGIAIDNQTIAQFMTRLEASSWFEGVRLEVTQQVAKGGADLKSFSLKATVVYPKAG